MKRGTQTKTKETIERGRKASEKVAVRQAKGHMTVATITVKEVTVRLTVVGRARRITTFLIECRK